MSEQCWKIFTFYLRQSENCILVWNKSSSLSLYRLIYLGPFVNGKSNHSHTYRSRSIWRGAHNRIVLFRFPLHCLPVDFNGLSTVGDARFQILYKSQRTITTIKPQNVYFLTSFRGSKHYCYLFRCLLNWERRHSCLLFGTNNEEPRITRIFVCMIQMSLFQNANDFRGRYSLKIYGPSILWQIHYWTVKLGYVISRTLNSVA